MYIRIPAAKPPQRHLKLETTRITILCPAPWPKLHIDARFQLRILAAKGRWWQIQEILLTLSVTNVKKAGREDDHTSVHNGLKLDLCCVCHENLTSIRLHQHEVLYPSPQLTVNFALRGTYFRDTSLIQLQEVQLTFGKHSNICYIYIYIDINPNVCFM